jgi:protein O-GlcNAc transferase
MRRQRLDERAVKGSNRLLRLTGLYLLLLTLTWASGAFGESAALNRARGLIAEGKLDQAVSVLNDLVHAEPANFQARVLLGSTLAIQGARSEAIDEVNEAVKLRPRSGQAYDLLGSTLSRFMETTAAKSAFERAIELDPSLAEAHVHLALLLAQSGDWQSAGEHLDQALRLQANTPPAAYTVYLRAKIYMSHSQAAKANADLERAVRIRPKFAEAWSDLGWTRRVLLDDAGAMRALEKSVALDPQDPLAQYRLGTACLRGGKLKCAVEHLRASLRWGGADRPTLYNLELALRKSGDVPGAQEIRRQMEQQLLASRISSENGPLVSNLNDEGMKLEQQGEWQQATEKYRMALELDPTAGGVRLNYGLSLCRLKQWQQGIKEIEEVLRLDPDNGAAARALYIAREQAGAEFKPVQQR